MRRAAENLKGGGLLRRLKRDRRGAGAIEFAFLAPVLIVLYIGAVELSVAMSVNKKLGRATATVADLVTQGGAVNKAYLRSMVDVAKGVMAPYDPDPVQLTVTGISIDENGSATVDWSWRPNGSGDETPYEAGEAVDLPENLLVPETYLVRSEISYRHSMITSFPITGESMAGIDMGKTYHFRPRIKDRIECQGCNS